MYAGASNVAICGMMLAIEGESRKLAEPVGLDTRISVVAIHRKLKS